MTKRESMRPQNIEYLQERLEYLEKSQRSMLDSLVMAAQLGNFQPLGEESGSERTLLDETLSRLRRLIRFQEIGIYLTDPDLHFNLTVCDPPKSKGGLEAVFEHLVQERTVAWSLQRRTHTYAVDADGRDVILHPLVSAEKVMGIFVGVLGEDVRAVYDSSLSILSIILQSSANALENLYLRQKAENAGCQLEAKVEELEREIRRRDKAESGLRNSRRFLKKTLDAIPEPVFIKSRARRWLEVNQAMADYLGVDHRELIGQSFDHYLMPEDSDLFGRTCEAVLENGREQSVEAWISLPDGRRRYCVLKNALARHPETGESVVLGVLRDLTEQKKAEAKVKEESRRLYALLEGLPAFVYVQGNDGVIRYCNKSFKAIFGDSVGKKCFNVFKGPDRRRRCHSCSTHTVFETGKAVALDKEYVKGRIHMIYEQLLESEDGPCVLAMGIDVTDQRRTTDALRESERRYRDIFDNIQDVYFELDSDGRIREISPSVQRYTPLGRDQLIGSYSASSFASRDEFEGLLGKLHEFGELRDEEIMIRNAWMQDQYFSLEAEARYGSDGSIMKIVGSLHDIDTRRKAELRLKQSESKYRELVHNAHSIIVRWSPEGLVSFFNEHGQALFGLNEKEIFGKPLVGTILPQLAPDGSCNSELVRMIVSNPQEYSPSESEHILPDGTGMWCSWTHRGVYDAEGRLREILSVGADITSRRKTEMELLDAKALAEAASEAKSEFLANMSHEIRTPLNGVLGMLQLLRDTPMNEEQEGYAETALESGRSLLTVINDILDLSKIEAGRFEPDESRFEIYRLVSSVVQTFEHQAKMTGVVLEAEVEDDVPNVLIGDGGRLRQILFNLLGNAMKFTHEGGVKLTVGRLPLERDNELQLLFTVSDTGIGIPDDKINLVFEAFTQVDGSYTRKYQGSGLGLGIVRRLVHKLGGTLTISSEGGVGTEVLFRLGFSLPRSTRKEVPELAVDEVARTGRVLVVEDNRVNQIMACRSLEKLGYATETAGNGVQALEMLREKGPFACVLMDMQMPEMDGLEASVRIRNSEAGEACRNVPIVAMTAHAMRGDREKFISAGMNAYLSKPFEMEDLRKVVQRMVTK